MELQPTSFSIWESKYQLKNQQGHPVDLNVDATFARVAHALSNVEQSHRDLHESQFLWAMHNGAIPAGRIMSNAGAGKHKPATSLINCTVSDTVPDSMDGILSKLHEAGLTLKAGCGIGYDFTTLRPKGAFVSGAGAYTSGPLSFMDIYDKMCFTVSSAGGRRGAQMATFDISHPDVLDFIKAKRENGRLRQFNLSCLITYDFIEAVKNDSDWNLVYPVSAKENPNVNATDIVWKDWPVKTHYVHRIEDGKVACRIYKTIKARRLWDMIMASTYDYAEPGFILIDRVNEMNNNWFCEIIRATNPCGEQPLPPYGACLLGSINLTKFVDNPFTDSASFNMARFEKVVKIFTRMLDNVVDISNLPLPQQQEEILRKRRHGMGFFGLGSALTMMKIKYGTHEAVQFTEALSRCMALTGLQHGVELAKEKGAAPIMDETFTVSKEMLAVRPELLEAGFKEGEVRLGKELIAYGSRYLRQVADDALIANIATYGMRFTHHTSIAPTGTIALSVGDNASNGIEPSFSHQYSRNVIVQGKKTKEKVDVLSYEFKLYKELVDPNATIDTLPDYFVDASSVTPKQHVDMQAAAQKWVDSAISKTINVPTDISFDAFKDIYMYAADRGLKGCTTFRFNPEAFQGVLVTEKDLENTTYKFTLADGSVLEVKGNEEIEYDGEVHTAANLYDALKEGYYGKL